MKEVKIRSWYWVILVTAVVGAVILGAFSVVEGRAQIREQRLDAVRGRIERINQLVTQRYHYRDVVFFEENSRFLGLPAGQQKVLFSISMEIVAGVDLSRGFSVEPDRQHPQRVLVTLPGATILRVDADEESIRQYLVRERLGSLDYLDVAEEIETAKARNRRDAEDRGILIRAEQQSEELVRSLLRNGGFSEVEIRFRPREELRG